MNNNPFLQPFPNPAEPIEAQRKKEAEFNKRVDRLFYETFILCPAGKELADILMEQYVIPAKVNPQDPNYQTLVTWWDGFKTAMRMLKIRAQQFKEDIKP